MHKGMRPVAELGAKGDAWKGFILFLCILGNLLHVVSNMLGQQDKPCLLTNTWLVSAA